MRIAPLLLVLAATPAMAADVEPLEGVYAGPVFGAHLPVIWNALGEGAQFAMRLGFHHRNFQFQLEVAPATALFGLTPNALYMFEAAATAGYLWPISDMVSWIFRIGGGGGGIFGPVRGVDLAVPLGEVRWELVGVAIRTSNHFVVEANIPSFRVMFPVNMVGSTVMLAWVTNVGFAYLF